MIATTIEQSKELVRLGLDPATSDMWWIDDQLVAKSDKFDVPSNDEETTVHCAWSLSALLEVMPPYIKGHHLKIEKTRITDMWYIDYQYLTNSEPREDLLTAAYEMVCWLLEQDLIKKGDNND